MGRTWRKASASSPGAEFSFDFTKVVNVGLEYYADYGRIGSSCGCTSSSSRSLRWPT